jgi:D-alanyl-D-alanine carboxypeptidase
VPPPAVVAQAYAVLERSCGATLAVKNERERLPPASITKIITALVVSDRSALDAMVNIEVSGKEMAKRGSSVMGIEPGMRLSVTDLLYGLFLPSGNDAALALAAHVSGDVDSFVSLMNEKATQLGMNDSHFANPHGLDARDHLSSALDMANAGRALLDNQILAKISAAPAYIPTTQAGMPGWTLENGNKLLKTYPGAFGIKIGYTSKAKQTIVAAAERNGRQIIVSLLGADNRYADSTALLDWAFTKTTTACQAG